MAKKVEFIKTDFILLNKMLGGGVPRGKIFEIFGFEGCGKTTLALELSKHFAHTYYIDFEHELDMGYVRELGVKLAVFKQPVTFEDGIDEFFKKFKEKKNYDLLIIDTIGSAITNEQIEKDISQSTVGSLAQKVTIFLRKAEKILKPLGVAVFLLNHKKDKIGAGFGEQYYTTGGRQIKFSSSIILSITKKKDKIFDDGIIANIWQKRNKVMQTHENQNCMYTIRRGRGISRGKESFDLGLECKIVKQEGQKFKIGSREFRGKAAVIEFLDDEPKVRKAINGKWLEQDQD